MFGAGIKLMDDEDEFFGNLDNSRSNLADLFGSSQPKSNKMDHSLKYTPQKPKHPLDLEGKKEKPSGWNIEVAKVVTAFKLVNEDNSPQGRIGLAILKSPEGLQKIILYRTKNNVLSTKTLTDDIKLHVKKSYLQYTDDLQVFWSILFENDDETAVLDLIKDYIVKDELIFKETETTIASNLTELENPSSSNNYSKKIDDERTYSSDDKIKTVKENILTRISKMGQALPTLTNQHHTTTDLSDSSDTELKKKNSYSKPNILARKPNKVQQQIMTLATTTNPSNTQIISTTGIVPIQYSQQMVHQESQYLNMMLSENRTQNTEVRMNISKLETKIEKVLDKIDFIHNKNDGSGTNVTKVLEDEILSLEEKVINLKKENRNLRQQIEDFTLPVNVPQEIELKNTFNKEDFNDYKNIINDLDLDINNYDNSIKLFQDLIEHLNKNENCLKSSLEIHEKIANDRKIQLEELEKKKGQEISDLGQQIEHLELKIINLETLTETLRKDKEKFYEELENSNQTLDNIVKSIMNKLYQNLVSHFNDDNRQFASNEILKICAIEIKNQTKNAISERKK